MKLQISSLFSKREKTKSINYDFEMKEFYFEGDLIKPLDKVLVDGVVSSRERELTISLKVKTKLNVTCSRCLDTFIYPIDFEIEERFTSIDETTDSDVIFVKSDELDITDFVEREIISTLPIKRLCSLDCKGLCHICGNNLNINTCTCDDADVDVRLAGLKALLENKEV
ncbi:MAG: YceD family protein [Clostridium sp.]|uniref:YceD family protein n=1 Tax=Clostridium sp. TaxID=1506 RepID=UPI003F3F57EE